MEDTRCINLLVVEYADPVLACDPNDPDDQPDTQWCHRPGKPIMTEDGVKYVCDDCRRGVEAEGHLNGFLLEL